MAAVAWLACVRGSPRAAEPVPGGPSICYLVRPPRPIPVPARRGDDAVTTATPYGSPRRPFSAARRHSLQPHLYPINASAMAAPSGRRSSRIRSLSMSWGRFCPRTGTSSSWNGNGAACVANPDGGSSARVHGHGIEVPRAGTPRGGPRAPRREQPVAGRERALAARCDAMQKLVQEAVPEAARRLEYERSARARREVPRRRRRLVREKAPRRAAAVPRRRPRFCGDEERGARPVQERPPRQGRRAPCAT